MPILAQNADQLRFWGAIFKATVLQPFLPLEASVAAVPATEAICERLLNVLIGVRLRLLGSRMESILITNFNSAKAKSCC
jgi:hypothetical protein